MSNVKNFVPPPIDPVMLKGQIVDWNFRNSFTPINGTYAIRFTITFSDGSTMEKQSGGWKTEMAAKRQKEFIISQLHQHEYVALSVSVKNFFDYWLYYHMVDVEKIAYGTFVSYRNIIYNYLIPKIGNKKLNKITKNNLSIVLESFQSDALLKMAYSVLGSSFKYAKSKNLIAYNIAKPAIKASRVKRAKKRADEEAATILPEPQRCKKRNALNAQQIIQLLYAAKTDYPDIYLPLLLACTTGCRISELIALKYSDVDYKMKELSITVQLGRTVKDSDCVKENFKLKQETTPKSSAGVRKIPLPYFVIAEIVLAQKRDELFQKSHPDFCNMGYIWHQKNGLPHARQDYAKPFRALKEQLNISSDFVWHDLRHCYATLMKNNGANLKKLVTVMGHFGMMMTDVYIDDNSEIVQLNKKYEELYYDILPVYQENSVLYFKENPYPPLQCKMEALFEQLQVFNENILV